MAEAPEKTAEELAAEERELAIKRGDIVEDEETVEASAERVEEPAEEGDDGGEEELEAADSEAESDEAEGEGAADSAPEASAKGEDEDIRIPKARFDEAQQKHRAKIKELEDKLSRTERQHAQKQTNEEIEAMQNEVNELEDKWESFLLEGEEEKARAVRREVNAKRNEIVQKQLIQQSQQTGNAAVEQIRYETKLAILEEKYPILNPDAPEYNQAVEQEVGELKAAFEGQGWGSTAALEKAVHYAIREQKAPPPVEDSQEERTEIKKSQRAHKARKAAAEASRATPPDASRAGRDSDKGGKGDGLPDVSKMTPDQFDKWAADNPSQMAQLRGDTLSADEAAA